jgi:hypothetical protein
MYRSTCVQSKAGYPVDVISQTLMSMRPAALIALMTRVTLAAPARASHWGTAITRMLLVTV